MAFGKKPNKIYMVLFAFLGIGLMMYVYYTNKVHEGFKVHDMKYKVSEMELKNMDNVITKLFGRIGESVALLFRDLVGSYSMVSAPTKTHHKN